MPTNLPPEYYEVDKRYRAAVETHEKIQLLEELISTIPKHKGTDHLRADLKSRLAKLKNVSQSKKSIGRHESPFRIEREGAGQVVLVGPTNTGKSALVEALTNASPEVSSAPFTTWSPTPGMMHFENIQIQLIDTPPLNPEYLDPTMMELLRRADLIILIIDLQTYPIQQLEESLALLKENRIIPLHQSLEYPEDYPNRRQLSFVPFLVLANKCDGEDADEIYKIYCELLDEPWPCIPVSAVTGRNFDDLKRTIFNQLEIVRVYAKPPGRDPDLNAPFVLKLGGTVEEFARKVHQDFVKNLKSARVWGSADFDGQMVGRDYVLADGDIIELRD